MAVDDDWLELAARLHRYAVARFDQRPIGITFEFGRGGCASVPLPEPPRPTPARLAAPAWASGPEPKHLSDFQRVYWPGLGVFNFSPKQALVIGMLWGATGNDDPSVSQAVLLQAADSDCSRLLDLFRSGGKTHPAWNVLVMPGEGAGTFRLPERPASGEVGG